MNTTSISGFKFIANPLAGRGKSIYLPRLIAGFGKKYNVDVDLVYTSQGGEAVDLARQAVGEGWPAVVAVGGDGTAGEVLTGLLGSEVPLGVIPAGTGNDLARTLGIPLSFEAALDCLIRSEVRKMDMGRESGRYFGMQIGLGFPSDVMEEANRWTKSPLGRRLKGWVNIAAGLVKALIKMQPVGMTLRLDGQVVETRSVGVLVMNTRYAGKGLLLAPDAQFDDGLLDVIVFGDVSRLEVIHVFPRVYKGKHMSHPAVKHYRSRRVEIKTEVPLRKMFDGDMDGFGLVEAEVVPEAVRILTPLPRL